jgi:hypothetical protein
MWLEQTWVVWLPIACAAGGWVLWQLLQLRAELSSLRKRISDLERDHSEAATNRAAA